MADPASVKVMAKANLKLFEVFQIKSHKQVVALIFDTLHSSHYI